LAHRAGRSGPWSRRTGAPKGGSATDRTGPEPPGAGGRACHLHAMRSERWWPWPFVTVTQITVTYANPLSARDHTSGREEVTRGRPPGHIGATNHRIAADNHGHCRPSSAQFTEHTPPLTAGGRGRPRISDTEAATRVRAPCEGCGPARPSRPSPGRPRSTIDDRQRQTLKPQPAGHGQFEDDGSSSQSSSITSTTSRAVMR
jgi:hypothetical protein